jgi:hypothetical protein
MTAKTLHAAVVEAIRRHLDDNRIMQRDLAAALGCEPSYVANVFTQRPSTAGGRTTLRSLQRILDVLGLDVDVSVVDRKPAGAP